MASDGLGKTMVETAEETAGAGPNYAPVVGAGGLWEHAPLCSLSRDLEPSNRWETAPVARYMRRTARRRIGEAQYTLALAFL